MLPRITLALAAALALSLTACSDDDFGATLDDGGSSDLSAAVSTPDLMTPSDLLMPDLAHDGGATD